MDRHDYQRRADACLAAVTSWLEAFDPDEVDYTTSDGVVTIQFSDGARFVLNRQSAANQMWFAAGARAWHYDWREATGQWVDAKDGHDMLTRIAEAISAKIGRRVTLTA